MAPAKRLVEVFTAGCPICAETVNLVKSLACPSCDVQVHDLRNGCVTNECRDGQPNMASQPSRLSR